MIHSMTAYGRAENSDNQISISCEIRSVNHRYLEIAVRMPEELRPLEQKIRDYHQKLREFYYPLLFDETEFNYQIMSELPQFSEQIKISKNDKENS